MFSHSYIVLHHPSKVETLSFPRLVFSDLAVLSAIDEWILILYSLFISGSNHQPFVTASDLLQIVLSFTFPTFNDLIKASSSQQHSFQPSNSQRNGKH